jgi:diaminopimelate dehydrogenase
LGKGVESAIAQNPDMELVAVVTRRSPDKLKLEGDVLKVAYSDILSLKGKVDALVICGGSATDLPEMTPSLAKDFNVIDSFDTHAKIPEHFARVNEAAMSGDNIAMISVGWDPGLFSASRVMSSAVLPDGVDYTFWGKGVSQGHSDAIRRIEGVVDARQYTIPVPEALDKVLTGDTPTLTTRDKHTRECFVVVEEGADKKRIEKEIVEMPNYFADYNTTVHFVTKEELDKNHAGLPHGGVAVRNGRTGKNLENTHTISYNLRLDSNPEFTSSAIISYTRAMLRMRERGMTGCYTVFDVAPVDMSAVAREELIAKLL